MQNSYVIEVFFLFGKIWILEMFNFTNTRKSFIEIKVNSSKQKITMLQKNHLAFLKSW